MGRPREHNEQTATLLLDAAERLAELEGIAALSVRRVAYEVGTTTRAVYSVFGSKDGLVAALGVRAFDDLGATVAALPKTGDTRSDLVQAGLVFRRFALKHPALFRIGVQRVEVSTDAVHEFAGAASGALNVLHERVGRLADQEQVGHRTVEGAACELHALCEGLAALEERCRFRDEDGERLWTDALSALVHGWSATTTVGRFDGSKTHA